MRSSSFAAEKAGNVVIYVHTAEPPSDEEWNKVLEFYREANASEQLRVLVYTAGSAPNAAQRAKLSATFGARRVTLAIMTDSALARAAGIAVHWFRPDVRIFAPTELPKALEHLGVSGTAAREVEAVFTRLKSELRLGFRRANA